MVLQKSPDVPEIFVRQVRPGGKRSQRVPDPAPFNVVPYALVAVVQNKSHKVKEERDAGGCGYVPGDPISNAAEDKYAGNAPGGGFRPGSLWCVHCRQCAFLLTRRVWAQKTKKPRLLSEPGLLSPSR